MRATAAIARMLGICFMNSDDDLLEHLYHLRWLAKDLRVELMLHHLRLRRKYSRDQPRVPSGNPGGGQWTSGGAGTRTASDVHTPTSPQHDNGAPIVLAGGFTSEQRGMTVQSFVSTYCRGSINSVLPGQFLDMSVADVMIAANGGDAAARTCLKLLGRDLYRK
jgi:hypothetical protein